MTFRDPAQSIKDDPPAGNPKRARTDRGHGKVNGHGTDGELPAGLLMWSEINRCSVSTDRLIKRLMGAASFVVIAGPTGSGKTFLALDAAIHVANGWEWFGRKTMRAGILYVGAEGQDGIRKRIPSPYTRRRSIC
jgi:hypothetical protein